MVHKHPVPNQQQPLVLVH